MFPRDPDFREKAGRVLDLYERRWDGHRLHPAGAEIAEVKAPACELPATSGPGPIALVSG